MEEERSSVSLAREAEEVMVKDSDWDMPLSPIWGM